MIKSLLNLSLVSTLSTISIVSQQALAKNGSFTPRPWMKCISMGSGSPSQNAPDPTAPASPASAASALSPGSGSSSGSSSGTASNSGSNFGMIFNIEPKNSDEISADILSLNNHGEVIKQIGHAEVLSSNSGTLSLQQGPDSPFPFSMTLSAPNNNGASGFIDSRGLVTGTISNVGLFGGQSLAQVQVECRIYSKMKMAAADRTSGGTSGAPTTTPQTP